MLSTPSSFDSGYKNTATAGWGSFLLAVHEQKITCENANKYYQYLNQSHHCLQLTPF
jgi:peptide methionine sulfoxide reductase MsrB